MQATKSLSPSDPLPLSPRAKIKMIRTVSDSRLVRALVGSPRLSRSSSDVPENLFARKIRKILNCQNRAGKDFIEEVKIKFGKLVEGTLDYQKPLAAAIQDIWRITDKLSMITQNDIVTKHIFINKSEVDAKERNRRLLLLLSQFEKGSSIQLPKAAEVDWENDDHARAWAQEAFSKIDSSCPLARFVRSCSQERYNNTIIPNPVLVDYGVLHGVAKPPVIKAALKVSDLASTRLFLNNGSYQETLLIPVDIQDRISQDPIARLSWTLQFFYDESCLLTDVKSSCL